jgi:hypothetical protein
MTSAPRALKRGGAGGASIAAYGFELEVAEGRTPEWLIWTLG